MNSAISRRQAIAGGAAAVVAGATGFALARGGGDGGSDAPTPANKTDSGAEPTAASPDCILSPEQTEGPYYLDNGLIRSDIRDGVDGVPLELRLQVLAAPECTAIEGATVELWHCDALGNYSGVSGDSESFCRGGQRTDADGEATFTTIYPGWYGGRATHIHVKVHVDGDVVHTGQLYFPDATNAAVHTNRAPYSERGMADTPNSSDGIFGQGGAETTVRVARRGSGYFGRLALGVET